MSVNGTFLLLNLFSLLASEDLLELVNKNQDSHFFLDEVHLATNHISSKVLAEISNRISKDNYLWIACQSDRLPIKSNPNLKGKIN
jgi:hypothetical protein